MTLHPLLRQSGQFALLRPARQTTTTIFTTGRRTISSTPPAPMSSTTTPKFSEGSDVAVLAKELQDLQESKWSLTQNGQGIERSFKFKTFAKTWDFMTAVSLQCKIKNHHPEWSNVYNTTFIRWTTHHPEGLSAQDTSLAKICDGLARDFGEIPQGQGSSNAANSSGASCQLNALANNAASTAGDCCVPKK